MARNAVRISTPDALRASIPSRLYLYLLHHGATTGFLPRLDPHGQPTGQFDPMPPDDRVRVLQYMTNKVLPDAKVIEVRSAPPPDAALDHATLTTMTTDQLRAIAAGEDDDDALLLAPASPDLAIPQPADDPARQGGGAPGDCAP